MNRLQRLFLISLLSFAALGQSEHEKENRSKFEMFFHASKNIFQVVAVDEHITETRIIVGEDTIIRRKYNTAVVKGRVFDIEQNVSKRKAVSWYTGNLSIHEIYQPVVGTEVTARIIFENIDGEIEERERVVTTNADGTFQVVFDTSTFSHSYKNVKVQFSMEEKNYAVRPAHIFQFRGKKPIAIVDIDKTIFDGGTSEYIYGSNYHNQPIKNAVELLHKIRKTHQIVYITHRDVRLSLRTQMWIREKGFPIGPIFLSTAWDNQAKDYLGNYLRDSNMSAIIHKSGAFKYVLDQGLKVDLALGDKFTDAHVYTQGGAQNIVIYRFKKGDSQYSKVKQLEAYSDDHLIEDITLPSKQQRLFIVKKWDGLLEALTNNNICKKLLAQK